MMKRLIPTAIVWLLGIATAIAIATYLVGIYRVLPLEAVILIYIAGVLMTYALIKIDVAADRLYQWLTTPKNKHCYVCDAPAQRHCVDCGFMICDEHDQGFAGTLAPLCPECRELFIQTIQENET